MEGRDADIELSCKLLRAEAPSLLIFFKVNPLPARLILGELDSALIAANSHSVGERGDEECEKRRDS
jgi:hypothetical protein